MNLVIEREDHGLAQAWLMATVGSSKATSRRASKQTLRQLSIPELCKEVALLAEEARHLRLTSNLLYGVSLIYKQKVAYMATDLSLVSDRITSPLFTKFNSLHSISGARSKPQHNIKLCLRNDCSNFNMELDFVPDFYDDEVSPHNIATKNALAIKAQDEVVQGSGSSNTVSAFSAAEAKDKSFLSFLNKSVNSKDLSLEECLDVDFEFDQHGDIIGHDEPGFTTPNLNILDELDLDELTHIAGETVKDMYETEDKQKPIGHTTPNLRIPSGSNNKRRKIKLLEDSTTMLHVGGQLAYIPQGEIAKPLTVSDLFQEMSTAQPPFLNMCYRMIFGSPFLSHTASANLPSSSRHPSVSNIESFLKDFDEIEQGRNVPSRRPSSSLVDEALYENLLPETAENGTPGIADFEIEPLSPMLEDLEDSDADVHRESAQKLEDFLVFLEERASHVASKGPQVVSDSLFTFEALIPSRTSIDELQVTRSLAANAVSSLLQLASSGHVKLASSNADGRHLSTSDEIYITFN